MRSNRAALKGGREMTTEVLLYVGEALGKYGFPNGHPFGPDRQDAFWKETIKQGLDKQARLAVPRRATREEIERFHTPDYVNRVDQLSAIGYGSIDYGDTPAYPGVYDASSAVVGAALEGPRGAMRGACSPAFHPFGGLLTPRAGPGPGFSRFTDLGGATAHLARKFRLMAIAC